MLNPDLILPLMAALAALVLAATVGPGRWDRPLLPPASLKPKPRHRMTSTTAPYRPRPWDQVTADFERLATPAEPIEYGLLDPQVPLAEVEEYLRSIGVANWRQPLTHFEQQVGVLPTSDEDADDLVMV